MRVLLADHDSTQLEAAVRALGSAYSLDVVTSKANGLDLLRLNDFHLVIACEQLDDGSGLDFLSQAERRHPDVLRVFAAEPERLRLLANRLRPFKLFQTLDYPLDPAALTAVLEMVDAAFSIDPELGEFEHVALEEDEPAAPAALVKDQAFGAGFPPGYVPLPPPGLTRERGPLRRLLDYWTSRRRRHRVEIPRSPAGPKRSGSIVTYSVMAIFAVVAALTAVAGVTYKLLTIPSAPDSSVSAASDGERTYVPDLVPLPIGDDLSAVRARRDQKIQNAETLASSRMRPAGLIGNGASAMPDVSSEPAPAFAGAESAAITTNLAPPIADRASVDSSGTADPAIAVTDGSEPRAASTSPRGPRTLEDLPPVVREARLVRRVAPDYPQDAARRRIEGEVDLAFTVTADGRVRDIEVVSANPPYTFDRAAIAALRRWRYDPRFEDGVPVDWPTQVRIEFDLND